MSKRKPAEQSERSSALRERAESNLRTEHFDIAGMSTEDIEKLVYELQVHQVELEIQNEELRDAQVELAHSLERYADLYEFAPVGYLTVNREGVIEEGNLTAATLLGVEKSRLRGNKMSNFIDRDAQGAWHIHRREVFSGESKRACELTMRLADRSRLTLQLQSQACRDEQGDLSRCRTALIDVTERKITQDALGRLNIDLEESLSDNSEKLEQSIERVRLLSEAVSSLGEGVAITGDGVDWPVPKIIFVNRAMCDITGYSADELIGKSPLILQGEKSDPETLKRIQARLAAGESCAAEIVNYRKDGSPYNAELFITPLFDAADRRTNFVSIHRDITEKKEAEEALRSIYEFNESLIETAQSVILVLDRSGLVLRFNPAFERLSGWAFAEAEGCDWFDTFVPERHREKTRRLFKRAIGKESTAGSVSPIMTKDGGEREVEWYDARLTDPDGNLIGLLCTGTDVTNRLRLEQEVINSAEGERQRIAQDLHDSLGSLLTTVDLRLKSLTGGRLKDDSRMLESHCRTLRGLVGEAIRNTRMIAKGLHPVGSHPEDLMVSLKELAVGVREASSMRCQFRCPEPVPIRSPVIANHLFRIAQEAVNNAVKHSGASQITISLECVDGEVVLAVVDNGVGFEHAGGTSAGLGLHTMNYRASAIGGSLNIKRRKSSGTRVICRVRIKG